MLVKAVETYLAMGADFDDRHDVPRPVSVLDLSIEDPQEESLRRLTFTLRANALEM